MHYTCLRLEQKWVEVTTFTQVDALINAVKNGLETSKINFDSEIVRTMVFANTIQVVDAVSQILTAAGIRCMRYHSNISLDKRTENLIDFQKKGGIFVCTDAAARGLDIPNISHVIQVHLFCFPDKGQFYVKGTCYLRFLYCFGKMNKNGIFFICLFHIRRNLRVLL